MAHSSGITATAEIQQAFSEARQSSDVRFLKLSINDALTDDPTLIVEHTQTMTHSVQDDFNSLKQFTREEEPAYFVFRMTGDDEIVSQDQVDKQWILIWHVSDNAKIKLRMLYASSIEAIKGGLGNAYFLGDYHTSEHSELEYAEFKKQWQYKRDPSAFAHEAMTATERQTLEERDTASVDMVHSSVSGLSLPLDDAAKDALKQFAADSLNLVSLKIADETIVLDQSQNDADAASIGSILPSNEPRYLFFGYRHEHDGNNINSIFFVYHCPIQSKIKNRMVYSSTKQHMVSTAASDFGITVEKSIEISSGDDITAKDIHEYIHPPQVQTGPIFSKPRRPGRGTARVTK